MASGDLRRLHPSHRVDGQLVLRGRPLGELLQRLVPERHRGRLPPFGLLGEVVLGQRPVHLRVAVPAGERGHSWALSVYVSIVRGDRLRARRLRDHCRSGDNRQQRPRPRAPSADVRGWAIPAVPTSRRAHRCRPRCAPATGPSTFAPRRRRRPASRRPHPRCRRHPQRIVERQDGAPNASTNSIASQAAIGSRVSRRPAAATHAQSPTGSRCTSQALRRPPHPRSDRQSSRPPSATSAIAGMVADVVVAALPAACWTGRGVSSGRPHSGPSSSVRELLIRPGWWPASTSG